MPKIVDHEQRRHAIAKAAMQVIAQKGLDATKLSDIGTIAGVTTGAITHYFSDKDSVLNAALEYSHQVTFAKMRTEQSQVNSSLLSVLENALPITEESKQAMAVWLAFWSRSVAIQKVADRQSELHVQWHKMVEDQVRYFCKQHRLVTPKHMKDCCEGITAFINGLIIRALLEPENWSARRLRKLLKRYLNDQGLP